MKKNITLWTIIVIVLVIGLIILVGMNHSSSSVSATATSTGSTQTGSQGNVPDTIVILKEATSPTLGSYLVAANGMTLYKYASDNTNISNCINTCATTWPPYAVAPTTASFVEGPGVSGAFSTIVRANGAKQLTYNGMPLYFWQGDTKIGDATGQDINGFTVVKP